MLGVFFEQQVGNDELLQLMQKPLCRFENALMATSLIVDCDLCDSKKNGD